MRKRLPKVISACLISDWKRTMMAIIVLFQSEIRQALITFGNRFRMPLTRVHRGQFGEGVYDEVILAATTLASTKTGALIVIERNVGLKNVTDGGVKLDAELSY